MLDADSILQQMLEKLASRWLWGVAVLTAGVTNSMVAYYIIWIDPTQMPEVRLMVVAQSVIVWICCVGTAHYLHSLRPQLEGESGAEAEAAAIFSHGPDDTQ